MQKSRIKENTTPLSLFAILSHRFIYLLAKVFFGSLVKKKCLVFFHKETDIKSFCDKNFADIYMYMYLSQCNLKVLSKNPSSECNAKELGSHRRGERHSQQLGHSVRQGNSDQWLIIFYDHL